MSTSLPLFAAGISQTAGSTTLAVNLGTTDLLIAGTCLIGIVAIGLVAAWRHKVQRGAADEYFLAGRSLG